MRSLILSLYFGSVFRSSFPQFCMTNCEPVKILQPLLARIVLLLPEEHLYTVVIFEVLKAIGLE